MQRALRLIYPSQCIGCAVPVAEDHGLCGACWRDMSFIHGLVCDVCGMPLPGEDDARVICDDCMSVERPWEQGRAALIYRGTGRRLVLGLKHGDRPELARPAARWMRRAAGDLLGHGRVLVPVPVHWSRLLRRRYNQAAVLARELARLGGGEYLPDGLVRRRATRVQDGMGSAERFANVAGAIAPHPRRGAVLAGRDVVLVDDVMTSGATLAAVTRAARDAGATGVRVIVLARVAKQV